MSATKENYSTLFSALSDLEQEKKDIGADMKERITAFSSQFGLHPKAVKRAFSLWKELQKDAAEFHEVDGDTESIITAILEVK